MRRFVHCSSVHTFDLERCGPSLDERGPRSVADHCPAYDRSKQAGESSRTGSGRAGPRHGDREPNRRDRSIRLWPLAHGIDDQHAPKREDPREPRRWIRLRRCARCRRGDARRHGARPHWRGLPLVWHSGVGQGARVARLGGERREAPASRCSTSRASSLLRGDRAALHTEPPGSALHARRSAHAAVLPDGQPLEGIDRARIGWSRPIHETIRDTVAWFDTHEAKLREAVRPGNTMAIAASPVLGKGPCTTTECVGFSAGSATSPGRPPALPGSPWFQGALPGVHRVARSLLSQSSAS